MMGELIDIGTFITNIYQLTTDRTSYKGKF